MTLPILTPRLILRPRIEADREPAWALACEPAGQVHLPVQDRATFDARFDQQIAAQAERGFSIWQVVRASDGARVGLCGLIAPRHHHTELEIGWRFHVEHWGQGYASEAAKAALDWGFASRADESIIAITSPANTASRRVMERIGMTHAPAEDFDHPDSPGPDDPLRACVLYRIRRPKGPRA